VLSIDKNAAAFYLKLNSEEALRLELMADRDLFFQKHGQTHIIEADFAGLTENIEQILRSEVMGIAHPNSIFRTDLIDIAGNEWMMQPVNKTRDVRYCIVSLKPLPFSYETLVTQSLARLQGQSYPHWHAVYFVEGLAAEANYSAPVRLVPSSHEGLNLQRAATRYCELDEVGVLLDYDESLGYKHDLRNIEAAMRNRNVYGAFLSAKVGGSLYKPRFGHEAIRRKVK
jgi:hypothetical protein